MFGPLAPTCGNQVLVTTEDLLSTSGWRGLLADFATGPQARLIVIKVMLVAGNPLIKGTFWFDDVKLTLAQTAAADHYASPLFAPSTLQELMVEHRGDLNSFTEAAKRC